MDEGITVGLRESNSYAETTYGNTHTRAALTLALVRGGQHRSEHTNVRVYFSMLGARAFHPTRRSTPANET